jgi:solute carrier family 25 folate transporter 32
VPGHLHVRLLLAVPTFLSSYETRKSKFQRAGYERMKAVTRASVEASILCTLITQPIWVVKTRMLLNTNQNISEWQNCKRQIREIYAHDGLKGALRGLELSLLLLTSGVVQMYVYEGA